MTDDWRADSFVDAVGRWARATEDERFEVDPRLTRAEREDHARMQLGIRAVLDEHDCDAYCTHFDAVAEDGRVARLRLAAASTLMAEGVGYAADGDALTEALMCAARTRWTSRPTRSS